ncbi:MAG TPA: hypothetical protein PK478_14880, partial [Nitrospira sp.]|nr:hypothetical protein [Nitrospira sp.]
VRHTLTPCSSSIRRNSAMSEPATVTRSPDASSASAALVDVHRERSIVVCVTVNCPSFTWQR